MATSSFVHMALISSEGECRLLAVLFHSIHSVVSDPQGTHCAWSRRDSANSRSCVAVPTAPGLAGDELKVSGAATAQMFTRERAVPLQAHP